MIARGGATSVNHSAASDLTRSPRGSDLLGVNKCMTMQNTESVEQPRLNLNLMEAELKGRLTVPRSVRDSSVVAGQYRVQS